MFWCHNCQKQIHSTQNIKCQFCFCEAIEEITSNVNPAQFQPYIPSSQQEHLHQYQNQIPNLGVNSLMRQLFGFRSENNMFGNMMRMSPSVPSMFQNGLPTMVRYTMMQQPIFGLILIDSEEEQKNPVGSQKLGTFQKVNMRQECAICHQKEGNGVKLPCKHQFHQHCIKPWFEAKNTCPCCRTAV